MFSQNLMTSSIRCQRCLRSLIIKGLLPRFFRIRLIKAVVQGRLVGEEVDGAGAVTLGNAAQASHSFRCFPYVIGPYVAVCKFIAVCFHGFFEPWMLNRCMARNQVEQNVHVTFVCLFENSLQILIRSVARCNAAVICDIVSCITEWGQEARVDPDGVAAQLLDVV